jgi:hypothetical protein
VITRSLAGILNGIPFLGTGIVLMDAGGRVGFGQRLRLAASDELAGTLRSRATRTAKYVPGSGCSR